MDFLRSKEFEKDIKKLDANEKTLLRKMLEKIQFAPDKGKPLRHLGNIFSERIGNKRLVYQILEKENKIGLLLYKGRDEVYEFLK
ncbi:Uncharacterised protein [Candidatus Anstonella stagnisolia]|nr:Uncharacterised protein [Candidatus Anstonella stagnisolia]